MPEFDEPIIRGDIKRIKTLIDQGASVNEIVSNGMTALHYAVERGKTAIVKLLIEKGADVNRRKEEWLTTPLMTGAESGRTEIVKALIEAGADVNLEDKHGITALVEAVGVSSPPSAAHDVVQALLGAGAKLKFNVLMKAAKNCSPETIKALIAAGAEVNAVTPKWQTPLTWAVMEKRADNVVALLEAGADPNLRNSPDCGSKSVAGKSALEIAQELKLKKIIPLLEAAASGKPVPRAGDKKPATRADVPSLWRRIEQALKVKAPDVQQSLNNGATQEEIEELEAKLGIGLPEDLKESYRLHNGENDTADEVSLIHGDEPYVLLTIKGIFDEWKSWKGLIDKGAFATDESVPDKGIRSNWWNSGWIPFASNGGGDSLCIDLAPTKEGTAGQVITMNHETPKRKRLAPSFAEWLAELAEKWEEDT